MKWEGRDSLTDIGIIVARAHIATIAAVKGTIRP